jgi:hypothetical protein
LASHEANGISCVARNTRLNSTVLHSTGTVAQRIQR